MSTEDFKLSATAREDVGKGASRRLRRLEGRVPAIVYGADKAPAMISVEHRELMRHLESESFYSHIITLDVAGATESVILKDLHRHPAKPRILHADFLRVSQSKKLTVNVPLHFINEDSCKGVKIGGGKIMHNMTQLEVSCLPKDLPEFIEVDMQDVDLGDTLHISDIKLPEGVESVALSYGADHDLPVTSIIKPKIDAADVEDEAGDN